MFTFEDFKKYCKAPWADEFYLEFKDSLDEYMIIIYDDHVSFQRCGYEGSGEFEYKDLDELYNADLIDGINLKRDWNNLFEIYPHGYGDFEEYCYYNEIEYIGELNNMYNVRVSRVDKNEMVEEHYDCVFNKEDGDESKDDVFGIAVEVTRADGGISKYLIYAFWYFEENPSYIIDGEYIILATNWEVLKISMKDNSLVALYEATDYLIGIHYSTWNGYILHTELTVVLLDKMLKEKWVNGDASDVTVPAKGRDPFRVTGKYVEYVDFEGYQYLIDKDGKTVSRVK